MAEQLTEKISIDDSTESIQHDDNPYRLYFNTEEFDDERAYTHFVKCCERCIRGSMEYKEWIKYLKESCGIESCQISDDTFEMCRIEIHHHPITLYHLVEIAVHNKTLKAQKFTTFDISKQIMSWHFKNMVGYIPLVTTLHEKFHSGFLKLPINMVHGNWKELTEQMELPDHIKFTVDSHESVEHMEGVSACFKGGVLMEND